MNQSNDNNSEFNSEERFGRPLLTLPAPADLPRYAEEGERDPFGQNEALLSEACRLGFEIAVEIAALAHSRGLCMMLPWPEPGTIEPFLRPWRSVVACEPEEQDLPPLRVPPVDVTWEGVPGIPVQELLQRAVVTLAALGESSGAHDRAAELLEHLGYIALSRDFQPAKLTLNRPDGPPLRFFYSIGKTAALIHSKNAIHGDMHPQNFLYDAEQGAVRISDVGSNRFLKRPLTLEERASDVGLLKLTCAFHEWETVKLGYREQDPEEAAKVFELI
jgi:hypothetical protein